MKQFPLFTLQDILFSKTFSDTKISIYLKQCQKHNIVWIEGIIAEIFRIMSSNKIDPKSKIHAIFLLREVVKTCQYAVLQLVQCYLLQLLQEVSLYFALNPEFHMNSRYFLLQGYNPSFPNISELSHNYVILGFEILYMCAMLRSKQTFKSKQLKKDSQFVTVLNKIKQKNPKIFKDSQLQKKLSIPQLKSKYKKHLQQFQENSYFYVDFYMRKIEDYLFEIKQNPIKQTIDFKILLKNGDVYLTSQAIARMTEIIDFVDDLKIKSKALSMINQMILWGDIQALITVNFTDYFQKIFRQLNNIDGSKGLKKGEQIFPAIKNQYEQKRKFYSDFLRCTEIWALSFPTENSIFHQNSQNDFPSPIFKNYSFLKQTKKFIFPQNPFLNKIQLEIRQNFRNKTQRNKLIIEDLNRQALQIQEKDRVSFGEIKQNMQNAVKNLEKLKQKRVQIKNDMQVHALMKSLMKFQQNFQLQLQGITEDVQQNILDSTIEKGLICVEIIGRIGPQYDRLRKGKIKMSQFLSICKKLIDFSTQRISSVSLNSSKSIQDRKSQLRNSISSNVNKTISSIKGMTEQTRIKIIRNKYQKRMNKIANRTNSDKDSSLSFSLYNTSKKSIDRQNTKLAQDSKEQMFIQFDKNVRNVKSDQKYVQSPTKSSSQNSKKIFIVTKLFNQDNEKGSEQQNVRNPLIEYKWKSSNQFELMKMKEPLVFYKSNNFSFIKTNPNLQFKEEDYVFQNNQTYKSPQSGNTETNDLSKSQDRRKFKKGVGLAKMFNNLTQKLIGPTIDVVNFNTFKDCFQGLKTTKDKNQCLSKHFTIINSELVKIDRLSYYNGQKMIVTFYVMPKNNVDKIRFNVCETQSIYLNVTQNKEVKANRNYFEMTNLKQGKQYSFQVVGSLLQTPIKMPKLTIKINDQSYQHFCIPFPLIHMLKFRRPQAKWLTGKSFQQADKVVSVQFERNKYILQTFSDIQEYLYGLIEIVTQQKAVRRYRIQASIDKTSFLLQIKQRDNKMSFTACLFNQATNNSLVQYFIAECLNLFS